MHCEFLLSVVSIFKIMISLLHIKAAVFWNIDEAKPAYASDVVCYMTALISNLIFIIIVVIEWFVIFWPTRTKNRNKT